MKLQWNDMMIIEPGVFYDEMERVRTRFLNEMVGVDSYRPLREVLAETEKPKRLSRKKKKAYKKWLREAEYIMSFQEDPFPLTSADAFAQQIYNTRPTTLKLDPFTTWAHLSTEGGIFIRKHEDGYQEIFLGPQRIDPQPRNESFDNLMNESQQEFFNSFNK